jgi:hypothetical protein
MRASKRQQAHDITVIPKDYSPAPDQIHLLMCIQERNLLGQTLGKADIVRVHPGNVTPARQFDALVQTLGESQPSAILDDTDSRVIQRERDPHGIIARTIVEQKQFKICKRLIQQRSQRNA